MMMNKNSGYRLRTLESPDRTLFLSVVFNGDGKESDVIEACYGDIGQVLTSYDMRIVQERIFGRLSGLRDIVGARDSGLTPANSAVSPPAIIEGAPVHDGPCAGILIRAVPKTAACPIEVGGDVFGASWRWGESQWVVLPKMTMPPRSEISDPALETEQMLSTCEQVLATVGFTFQDVFRTWFYLDDILSWYDRFNVGRTGKYQSWEMTPTKERPALKLPASTGIGVRNGDNGAGLLGLLAMRGATPIEQMSNPGQKDAFEYGSSFSRGALLSFDRGNILELSGTASIDETGATAYLGDPGRQIECTLDKIATLIGTRDFALTDLAGGAAFLKDRADYPVLVDALERRGLLDLPLIPMQAEVCRDELLFEIDGEFVQFSRV